MKTLRIVGFILAMLMIAGAAEEGGLTPEILKQLKDAFPLDTHNQAIINAVTNNDLQELVLNRSIVNQHDHLYNFKIETKGITDQKNSGRCWLFACLNTLRSDVRTKYQLPDFEFSQNYLFFWDKLEKANMFLEAMIETAERDVKDRELQALLDDPIYDGGWWNYAVALIEKYGVVPKEIMPETTSSENSKRMNYVLNALIRKDALELRRLTRSGKKLSTVRKQKTEMLRDIYRLLVYHLGVPPTEFTWRTENKDDKLLVKQCTPLSFYREVVTTNLKDYIPLLDHPGYPYDNHYQINFCRNMSNLSDLRFINIPTTRLKALTFAAVLDSTPIWFAAESGPDMNRENGIMAVGLYDYEDLFGINLQMSKQDRFLYRQSIPNHAMVFCGVDTLAGKARKWLVENSWGDDNGNKGYYDMYDDWFDAHVYTVILPKRYLPADILKLLQQTPEIIPAWDPMREFMF
jgi:bleomycin hydrolase